MNLQKISVRFEKYAFRSKSFKNWKKIDDLGIKFEKFEKF